MVCLIHARLNLIKVETVVRGSRGTGAGHKGRRTEQRRSSDDAKAPADHVPPAVTLEDHVPDRVPISWAKGHVVMGLVGFGPVAEEIRFRHARSVT
jgi:hypothetical protein